jgi:hypothetical protein
LCWSHNNSTNRASPTTQPDCGLNSRLGLAWKPTGTTLNHTHSGSRSGSRSHCRSLFPSSLSLAFARSPAMDLPLPCPSRSYRPPRYTLRLILFLVLVTMILPTVVYQAVQRVHLPQLSLLPMMPIPGGKGLWFANGHDQGVLQVDMQEPEEGTMASAGPESPGEGTTVGAVGGWWSGAAGVAGTRDGEEVTLGGQVH